MVVVLRPRVAFALVLCGFGVIAVGCGGSARVGSEPNDVAGGAGAAQAGAPQDQGGASADAGAPSLGGNPPIEAGAGGEAGALSCETAGIGIDVEVPDLVYAVCRGVPASTTVHAGGLSTPPFTCCGSSNSVPSYSLPMTATFSSGLDGILSFVVPASAPLGAQQLSVNCYLGGDLPKPIQLQVYDGLTVLAASAQIHATDELHITGHHLDTVTLVGAVPTGTGGTVHECHLITGAQPNDSSLSCRFDGITPGDYLIEVGNHGCSATNTPHFTVLP